MFELEMVIPLYQFFLFVSLLALCLLLSRYKVGLSITFCFLSNLVVKEKLDKKIVDVVIAYLYGSLDHDIHMKIPKGFKLPEACNSILKSMNSIKLTTKIALWVKTIQLYMV